MPRDAPVTIATLPERALSLICATSLRTSARCDRPAVDHRSATTHPHAVVEVECRAYLAGEEIDQRAQWRRIGHCQGRVLITHGHAVSGQADWDGRSVFQADHPSP